MLSGPRVIRELERIIAIYGKPAMIVSGNGTKLSSNAGQPLKDRMASHCARQADAERLAESFNGRLRNECLPQRRRRHHACRGSANHRCVVHRLQHHKASRPVASSGVRRYAQTTRGATGGAAPERASHPAPLTIIHEGRRGTAFTNRQEAVTPREASWISGGTFNAGRLSPGP